MTDHPLLQAATRIGTALVDRLLPRHCTLCGLPSGPGNLCAACAADLPRATPGCPRCALPQPQAGACGQCLRRPPPWDEAIAALWYDFPVDRVVQRLKFGRDFACGQLLAGELVRAVRERAEGPADLVAPVPLHRLRQFARSFNQADLLAQSLGRQLGIVVESGLLLRARRTRAHSGLAAAERQRNIRGAFRLPPRSARQVAGRHVALVDDVLTTGATLSECARLLQAAGARRVSVWVAARAPLAAAAGPLSSARRPRA